ncbi:MAG: ROK family protein [Chloroflexota bacterium]|nr:ROK family protein [Chloroflexota bacterium]MBI5703264.1 ROK family protein [Chloroflexota bacterium]
MTHLFGGIEGGGTKFLCAVGTAPGDIRREARFPTTTPAETLRQAVDFFKQAERDFGRLSALGVASFGPLDPHPASPAYGRILSTPKPGWTNADIVGPLRSAFDLPIAFDTDVNGAALGEWTWGAAQGLETFLYLTVGTGIGGGMMANGKLLHGLLHPEMGHILLPHDRIGDPFEGACPFHKDCFEGLASGPALEKRWGQRAETLPSDHPAWRLEAHYIALALVNYILTFSPQRIIIGGGVGGRDDLLPLIRTEVQTLLNGYVQSPAVTQHMDGYIVHPALGSRAGMLGAIALARQAITS